MGWFSRYSTQIVKLWPDQYYIQYKVLKTHYVTIATTVQYSRFLSQMIVHIVRRKCGGAPVAYNVVYRTRHLNGSWRGQYLFLMVSSTVLYVVHTELETVKNENLERNYLDLMSNHPNLHIFNGYNNYTHHFRCVHRRSSRYSQWGWRVDVVALHSQQQLATIANYCTCGIYTRTTSSVAMTAAGDYTPLPPCLDIFLLVARLPFSAAVGLVCVGCCFTQIPIRRLYFEMRVL